MILLRGRAATYGELWYDESPEATDGRVDILVYRRQSEARSRNRNSAFLTLVNDLDLDEAAIPQSFDSDCRYEIRRADQKDDLRMECIPQPRSRLREFSAFYDAFATQKGLAPCDTQWLDGAETTGRLLLTAARRHDESLVWHAYLLCGKVACLHHSASCFRDRSGAYRALVGRANRWLHWRDMRYLRTLGYARYDWGGMFDDDSTPERAGINRFKRGFGGREFRSHDSIVPVSMRGKLFLPLRDAWRAGRTGLESRIIALQSAFGNRTRRPAGASADTPRPPDTL